jgi:hypothetical protein
MCDKKSVPYMYKDSKVGVYKTFLKETCFDFIKSKHVSLKYLFISSEITQTLCSQELQVYTSGGGSL